MSQGAISCSAAQMWASRCCPQELGARRSREGPHAVVKAQGPGLTASRCGTAPVWSSGLGMCGQLVNQAAAFGQPLPSALARLAAAATDTFEDHGFFVVPIGRNNHGQGAVDGFLSRVAKKPLGPAVPTRDHAVEVFGKDCVVRQFYDRRVVLRGAIRDRLSPPSPPERGAPPTTFDTTLATTFSTMSTALRVCQVARGKSGGQLPHTLRAKTERNY